MDYFHKLSRRLVFAAALGLITSLLAGTPADAALTPQLTGDARAAAAQLATEDRKSVV